MLSTDNAQEMFVLLFHMLLHQNDLHICVNTRALLALQSQPHISAVQTQKIVTHHKNESRLKDPRAT